ncbi:MAG TPA: glucoamylase family protein [Flavipsychrobacter sp.]|nr:glucoamylase family protein [Flavipsychrobacter sp.]
MTLRNVFVLLLVFTSSIGCAQKKHSSLTERPLNLNDSELLTLVEKQTFRYFWDFAHPVSGLARERSNKTFSYGGEVVTIGGSGFGVMAIIVATERHWITRAAAVDRLLKMANFLRKANSYHGIFPHWMDGATGKTIPFSRKDDGSDIVETAYLFEGLLCARQYFNNNTAKETELRNKINWTWHEAEWDWHTQDGRDVLYWHWSPNNGWAMNFPIRGWNECLITYILAASSPEHSIKPSVYYNGWKQSDFYKNGKEYYGIVLPLGMDYGGPLFFAHYSFLGLDPHGLKEDSVDYWQQNKNQTLINYEYCKNNPKKYKGYNVNCWGLTSSDDPDGYSAHSPTNDDGIISPTAAISSLPYTPEHSMAALHHFYYDLGNKLWGPYGFKDAFDESKDWYADSYLAIDQGPEIVMIENYRTGLLWKLFMSCPEVQTGLKKLGFESPYIK